ncbi:ARM repeat-containing protein [Cylindrobasidium torrendii FP15055 ss-10]|uniref:ARM repeat-containing protein n=1 Tax=Cylindrobasidium torrendii FP15055 ss-10 TaxID=1314674 RepID=A0A0D7BSD2_9AGAR|nr:ARM repeat-containing protein [Cylindrobasidium torrendii FP15055 ss-10]
MAFLHSECNLTHGSLRPSNVLIDDQGIARIAEPALVKLSPTKNSDAYRYYSPEAWKGTISKSSDTFAFAMTAYEVFTGAAPWGVLSEKHVYHLIVLENQRPERPEPEVEAEIGLTTDLWNILENAWHQDPRLRPSFKITSRLLYKLVADSRGRDISMENSFANMSVGSQEGLQRSLTTASQRTEIDIPPTYEASQTRDRPVSMAHTMAESAAGSSPPRLPQTLPLNVSSRRDFSPPRRQFSPSPGPSTPPNIRRGAPGLRASTSSDSYSSHSFDPQSLYPAETGMSHGRAVSMAISTRSSPDEYAESRWGQESMANSPQPFRQMLPGSPSPYGAVPHSAPMFSQQSGDASSVWEHNQHRRTFVSDQPARPTSPATLTDTSSTPSRSQGRSAVLLANALQAEVQAARSNPEAVDRLLEQIQQMACESEKDAEKLVTGGTMPTLVHLLKVRGAEPHRLDKVLITMGLLAYDSISANMLIRTNTTMVLIELFKTSNYEKIATLALWVLNRTCRSVDVSNTLIKQGLVRLILDQGLAPKTPLSTARMCAWTLGALIHNDQLADTISDLGGISETVSYLSRVSMAYEPDPEDVCAAMYAVGRISRSIKLAKALHRLGCITFMAQHLQHSMDPDVLMWTARAVGCMMRPNSGDMAKALLEAGVAHGLARLPSVLPTDEVRPLGSFAFAVQRFSCAEWGAGTRKQLVEAGVVDALLAGLRTVADEPHPQIHIEMALAVSFLGDVGGGSIRKEIINAGGVTILKNVGAKGDPEVAKACSMAVTTTTGGIWSRHASSAKTAMAHNWSGGCPEYHPACPVPLFEIDEI